MNDAYCNRKSLRMVSNYWHNHTHAILQAILVEFDRLRRQSVGGPALAARQGENVRLNRYCNVVPYDANRVRLGGPARDYINASLLESPPEEQPSWRYIATQVEFPFNFPEQLGIPSCRHVVMPPMAPPATSSYSQPGQAIDGRSWSVLPVLICACRGQRTPRWGTFGRWCSSGAARLSSCSPAQ